MNQHNIIKTKLQSLLSILGLLILMGSIFIFSASSVFALETFGSSYYFVKKQIIGLMLGLTTILCVQLIPAQKIYRSSFFILLATVILTGLTLIPKFSSRIHGSSRWLSFYGFNFQPSELLKIGLILYLAYFIDKKSKYRSSFIRGFLPIIFLLGITGLILLKQPDFGLTVTLCITTVILLFLAQFNLNYLGLSLLSCIPVGIFLIITQPYRLKRILTFLHPWQDPKGAGFQIIQSLIAIGSGNFWGVGIGHSKQKFFYLPMQHTDFIFSIIAEETGFIGSFLLIVLYIGLLYFGLSLGLAIEQQYIRFVIFGFTILTSLQAGMNISIACGLLPTKGIGLPFISYGNSSILANCLIVGIIINFCRSYLKNYRQFNVPSSQDNTVII